MTYNRDYLVSALHSLQDAYDAVVLYDAGCDLDSLVAVQEAIMDQFDALFNRSELDDVRSLLRAGEFDHGSFGHRVPSMRVVNGKGKSVRVSIPK
jgi:hypothetical protein